MTSDETSCKKMLSPRKGSFFLQRLEQGGLSVGFWGVLRGRLLSGCCCTKCAVMTIARFFFFWLCIVVDADGASGEETSCKFAPGGGWWRWV